VPYLFATLETQLDDEHLWERLREIWLVVDADLSLVHFETEQEALDKKFRKSLDPRHARIDSLNVARYRETDDRENLLLFHKMGLDALRETHVAIRKRRLTTAFLNQWSILMECHGFVVASMMARGDDLQSKRAGWVTAQAVNKDPQRKWVAHALARLMNENRRRQEADWDLAQAIKIMRANKYVPDGYDGWFGAILGSDGNLKGTYKSRHLTRKDVYRLAAEPLGDLPGIDVAISLVVRPPVQDAT
jgi:hypothetical protein